MKRKNVWKRALAWVMTATLAVGSTFTALAEETFSDVTEQEELIVAEEVIPAEETDATEAGAPAEQDAIDEAGADIAETASAEEAPQLTVADIETVAGTVDMQEAYEAIPAAASEPVPLVLEGDAAATVDENGEARFSFTPSESGLYLFSGVTGDDYYGSFDVYNADQWLEGDSLGDEGALVVLKADVNYSCIVTIPDLEEGAPGPSVTITLKKPEIESVQAGQEKTLGSGTLDKWVKFTPTDSALYEWKADVDGFAMLFYDSSFEDMAGGSYLSAGQFYLSKDKTYYCNVSAATQKISVDKTKVDSFALDTAYAVSQNCWISFVPEKTSAYRISSEGLTDFEGEVDLFPDGSFEDLLDYAGVYEGAISDSFALEQGKKYYFYIRSYADTAFTQFSLTLSKERSVQSLQLEESNLTYEAGSRPLSELGTVVYDDNTSFTVWMGVGYSDKDLLGYTIKGSLYEADAAGNPDLTKPVYEDPVTETVEFKAGSYVLTVEIGTVDENGNFTTLPGVAPLYVKIFVTQASAPQDPAPQDPAPQDPAPQDPAPQDPAPQNPTPQDPVPQNPAPVHTHTYETVTDTPATCVTPGSTVKRCTTCGEVDEASRATIPPTGHTGGTATCVAKAVCSVCGQEYGELLPGVISLNMSSLKLKVKQKTTKLKVVEMGEGDSILSVKSDKTSVLKAKLAGGKITLTAQNKAGKAKVTVTLASGASKTVSVTVQKKTVATKSIKGVKKKLTMKKKQKITLKPKLKPGNSTDKIKFSSSNKKVAAVNGKGVVTAKKAGKATITVKAGKKSVKCKITVK